MKKFLKEFKDFAVRGNVIDLAIGIIIGSAFASITSALVQGILMPYVGLFIGGLNIADWVVYVPNFIYGGAPVAFAFGAFIRAIINFIIIALVVFLIVKAMNNMKKKQEAAPAVPSKEEQLLMEIRDILKDK